MLFIFGFALSGCQSSEDKFIGTYTNRACETPKKSGPPPITIFKDGTALKLRYYAQELFNLKYTEHIALLTPIDSTTLSIDDPDFYQAKIKWINNNEIYAPIYLCDRNSNYQRIKP